MLWDTPDKQMNLISLNFIISSRALESDIIRKKNVKTTTEDPLVT